MPFSDARNQGRQCLRLDLPGNVNGKDMFTDLPDPIRSGNTGMEAAKTVTGEGNSKFGDPLPKARILRQGAQMVFWRVFTLSFGAAGSIWAARCLGPENVGISGMIAATVSQAVLLVELNQNTIFVRHYKRQNSESERSDLITAVFTFRFVLCLALALAAGFILLSIGIPPKWQIAVLAGAPLLFFSCNQSSWALQAQENLPASYKAIAIPSIISACLYFSFFRSGIGPGSDVIVLAAGQALTFVLGWRYALHGRRLRLVRWNFLPRMAPLLKEGRWLVLTGFVFYLYTSFDIPLTGYLLPLHDLGQYRAAAKLAAVAQSFLSMAPLLLYPRLIEWSNVGAAYLWRKERDIIIASFCVLAPLSGLIFFLAPLLIRMTYGPAFFEAAAPCALLLCARFLGAIRGVLCCGLWAQNQDKVVTGLFTAVAAASLVLYLILIPRMGIRGAALVSLLGEALVVIGAFHISRVIGAGKDGGGPQPGEVAESGSRSASDRI